jgi:nicotinate-nucleotide pyrophosphorylase (carboxylating)
MQLNKLLVSKLIKSFLEEDVGIVDYTLCDEEAVVIADLIAKEPGLMCGAPFVNELFAVLDCKVIFLVEEGKEFKEGKIGQVIGRAADIFNGERTALNILARAIGIATYTRKIVNQVRSLSWTGTIAATRKTTPGFKICEKYAVYIGGGDPHRLSLHDMCMIKDNHIMLNRADFSEYLAEVKRSLPFSLNMEVETSCVEDALEAARQRADIVMLDNMSPADAESISARVKREYPGVLIEVSGGINEENIRNYLFTSIDIISMGALTMHYRPIDLSMRLHTE